MKLFCTPTQDGLTSLQFQVNSSPCSGAGARGRRLELRNSSGRCPNIRTD